MVNDLQHWQRLRQRLLRIPLVYKILIVNLLVVTFGAVAGTIITIWHVQLFPQDVHYELIALFAGAGVVISFVVNHWVLKRALAPLDRLQNAVDQVRSGAANVRVDPGEASDERFDRLAETFNQMIVRLEQNTQQMKDLSRQILQAHEEERYRLARDLHDEAAQALTSLLVRLRLLERARDPVDAQQRVQELRELTALALEDVRRVALDLRPTILDDLGLGSALEWRIDEFNKSSAVQATLSISGLEQRLPREIELTLYRVGQEALSNVIKHAQAQQVQVTLRRSAASICLEVVDDGIGFEPGLVRTGDRHGMGLVGMRERAGMIGGDLRIKSHPQRGTHILVCVPLESPSVAQPGNGPAPPGSPRPAFA